MTRILVVEDGPTQGEHRRRVLVEHAFEVVCASDVDAALAAIGHGGGD